MTRPASTRLAEQLLATLIAEGVRDVVVCPGSRSQALALTAAAAERAGLLRLHTSIDERQAGFLALGLGTETGTPAGVIVTSGTAVANLLPAMMEAAASRRGLIAITADRPAELHGIRANQTAPQAHLFARFARHSFDVDPEASDRAARHAARSCARTVTGPCQLNVRLRDPLSGAAADSQALADLVAEIAREGAPPAAPNPASGDSAAKVFELSDARRTVVIAGAGAGAAAEQFAHRAHAPLLAEAVSGARFGRQAVMAYETLLAELGDRVERAVVFGHPTLTRAVPALLRRSDLEVIVVDPCAVGGPQESGPAESRQAESGAAEFGPPGDPSDPARPDPAPGDPVPGDPVPRDAARPGPLDHFDPGRNATVVAAATVARSVDRAAQHAWLGEWIVRDRALRAERSTLHEPDLAAATATGYRERSAYARAEVAVKRQAVSRELLVDTAWRASWPHDRLVVAASRLVRVLDRVAQPRPVRVHANRGLAGIDGTVATALGIALAQQSSAEPASAAGVTRLIIGDLAFLHDATALHLLGARPRLQIIVGNDHGGTIFRDLEVAETASAEDFSRVLLTPQRVDLAQLAAAYGWDYHRPRNRGEYESLFTAPVTGPSIIEVELAD